MTTEAIKLLPSPPFPVEVELNSDSESLTNSVIPGEYIPLATCEQFLQNSLNQSRATKIFRHLWFAGALGNFRPLHQQIMFRREIIVCEEPNLHLIWFDDQIYIKPLPPSLTNHQFWTKFVVVDNDTYKLACGFLYSYTRLVQYESDFRIAMEKGLIRNKSLTWESWQKFRVCLLAVFEGNPDIMDKRYRYGELRLSRLNIIYLFRFRRFNFNGYWNRHARYGPIFSRYFATAVVIFAFASITLNAMQVAISQTATNVSSILLTTSYRFAVAILIAIVTIMVVIAVVFIPVISRDLRTGMIANKKMAMELRRQSSV